MKPCNVELELMGLLSRFFLIQLCGCNIEPYTQWKCKLCACVREKSVTRA